MDNMTQPRITYKTVVGPRDGLIHYAYVTTFPTLCGRPVPRHDGWRATSDDYNNRSRKGFCPRCIQRASR